MELKHGDVAEALATLGEALLANGNVEKAVRDLREATAIYEQTMGPTHPYTREVAASLERAEKLWRRTP
jgi:Flp pilus assembly protein TadD